MQIYQAGVKPILAPTGKKKKEGQERGPFNRMMSEYFLEKISWQPNSKFITGIKSGWSQVHPLFLWAHKPSLQESRKLTLT